MNGGELDSWTEGASWLGQDREKGHTSGQAKWQQQEDLGGLMSGQESLIQIYLFFSYYVSQFSEIFFKKGPYYIGWKKKNLVLYEILLWDAQKDLEIMNDSIRWDSK